MSQKLLQIAASQLLKGLNKVQIFLLLPQTWIDFSLLVKEHYCFSSIWFKKFIKQIQLYIVYIYIGTGRYSCIYIFVELLLKPTWFPSSIKSSTAVVCSCSLSATIPNKYLCLESSLLRCASRAALAFACRIFKDSAKFVWMKLFLCPFRCLCECSSWEECCSSWWSGPPDDMTIHNTLVHCFSSRSLLWNSEAKFF